MYIKELDPLLFEGWDVIKSFSFYFPGIDIPVQMDAFIDVFGDGTLYKEEDSLYTYRDEHPGVWIAHYTVYNPELQQTAGRTDCMCFMKNEHGEYYYFYIAADAGTLIYPDTFCQYLHAHE